jgi:hypothetical protein
MTIEKRKEGLLIKVREASFKVNDKSLEIGDFTINSPGEYEIKGISVEAFLGGVFLISAEGMGMVYANKKIKPKDIEGFGEVDVLFTSNDELIRIVEPKVAVRIDKIKKVVIKPESLSDKGTTIIDA